MDRIPEFAFCQNGFYAYIYTDMLFLFAWNEWSEGGYLEPDEHWQYGYLENLRDALNDI